MGFWGGAGAEGRLLGEGSLLSEVGRPWKCLEQEGLSPSCCWSGRLCALEALPPPKIKADGFIGAGNRAAPGPLFNPPLRVLFCLWKVLARGEGSALLGLLPAGQKCSLMAD